MTHVFISYKHDDHDFVVNLRNELKNVGLLTWADTDIQAGEEWKPAIDTAIRDSFAVIVVMTPLARASEYVTYEWSFAIGREKNVIPIMLMQTELHPILAGLNYLDFTNKRVRPWEALQKRLAEIKAKPRIIRSETTNSVPTRLSPKILKHQGLIKKLDSPVPKARESAAKILGESKVSIAIDKLIELLQDHEEDVRIAAAEALGQIGSDQATPELKALAGRTDLKNKTQAAAINALARIHSREAVLFLYKKYKEKSYDVSLKDALIFAVGQHNIRSIHPTIRSGLKVLGQNEFDNFESDMDRLSDLLAEAEDNLEEISRSRVANLIDDIESKQRWCNQLIAYFERLMEREKVKVLSEYDFDLMTKLVEDLDKD